MLVNFRFENFLSFSELTTFTMTLGKSKLHKENILNNDSINLLKFAALYGANASGKSNFINAISFAQSIILKGIESQPISRLYNRNQLENKDKQSKFEFEIMIGNKIFAYGFSILLSKAKIEQEWLYDVTSTETEIYTRSEEVTMNFDYLNFDDKSRTRLEIYSEDNVNNETTLFLTSLNKGKNKMVTMDGNTVFSDLYDWFNNVLEVIAPNETTSEFGMTYHDKTFLGKLGEYLKNCDTGVETVLLEETQETLKGIPLGLEKKLREKIISDFENLHDKSEMKKKALIRTPESMYIFSYEDNRVITSELKFNHGVNKINYSLNEESDGTIRLVELFSVLYNHKEKVFVIDELDRSLHPLLTFDFVKKFLEKENNQLIISTHEDRLLDLSLLRRDEIWFTKKDYRGNSILYSLEEYKERFDKNILNAYLDGRYGGIPEIGKIFPNIFNLTE